MIIGIPSEIKNQEHRVGMTPESVAEAVRHGHQVWVQAGAGLGIGAADAAYQAAGASIAADAPSLFETADMIVKVKEPLAEERARLRPGQLLFTYLHLAPDPEQAKDLLASGVTAIAYETVTDAQGGLPLLKPMSQVAGRLSVQAGAHTLEKSQGGRGLLLGGVPGVAPARVLIIGGGVVGYHAACMAVGLQADVTLLDRDPNRLEYLADQFGASVRVLHATQAQIDALLPTTDLVIGAVLVPGAAAPKLISRAQLSKMQPGSVLVDVAIDQGGAFETSRPTTHDDPTYVVDGVVHYCVANMPGAVARTSTYALNIATLPLVLKLAHQGWKAALAQDAHLAAGLNVWNGQVMHPAVSEALDLPLGKLSDALA